MFTLHSYTFKVVYFNIYPFILVLNPEHEGHNSGDRERLGKKKNVFLICTLEACSCSNRDHTMRHNSHLFVCDFTMTPTNAIHLKRCICAHVHRQLESQDHSPGGVASSHVLSPLGEASSSLYCVPVPDEWSLWVEMFSKMASGELDSCKGPWARLELPQDKAGHWI